MVGHFVGAILGEAIESRGRGHFKGRENYCSLSLRSYLFISWSVISHVDIIFYNSIFIFILQLDIAIKESRARGGRGMEDFLRVRASQGLKWTAYR